MRSIVRAQGKFYHFLKFDTNNSRIAPMKGTLVDSTNIDNKSQYDDR